MNQPAPPVDARGAPLNVGDLVCYTTASQSEALQFGTIDDIKIKPSRNSGWADGIEFKVAHTDALGNPTYHKTYVYDETTGTSKYVYSDKRKTSRLRHAQWKFLKL